MIVLSCETPHARAQTHTQKQREVCDLCDMGSNLCLLIGSDICTTHGMFSSLQSFLSGQANTGQPVQALRQGVCVCVCKCVCVCRNQPYWKLHSDKKITENCLERTEKDWNAGKTFGIWRRSASSSALHTNAEKTPRWWPSVFAASVGVFFEPFRACILLYVLLCYAGCSYHLSWFSAQRKCQKG